MYGGVLFQSPPNLGFPTHTIAVTKPPLPSSSSSCSSFEGAAIALIHSLSCGSIRRGVEASTMIRLCGSTVYGGVLFQSPPNLGFPTHTIAFIKPLPPPPSSSSPSPSSSLLSKRQSPSNFVACCQASTPTQPHETSFRYYFQSSFSF